MIAQAINIHPNAVDLRLLFMEVILASISVVWRPDLS
jgi:hypothetical protein